MRRTTMALVGVVAVSFHTVSAKSADRPSAATRAGLTRRVPPRQPEALTGSRFADSIERLDAADRERATLRELRAGNVPSFLRTLAPVELADRTGRSATIFVMPDYLAIGSDQDYLRMPMNLTTAATVAEELGFVLPTRKMVDAIYRQSAFHFVPQPLPAGPRMTSTDFYRTHNALIEEQARAAGVVPGTLVSGHKKDVVLTNLLARTPGRIAIYGWHRPDGAPIQPLSTVHGACYEDYSHGIRLVAEQAWQDGEWRPVRDLLRDGAAAPELSDEGVIRVADASLAASCSATPSH